LVETFPNNHNQYYEFARTLRFAFLYAKTVTLGQTHWPESNRVMQRNRRIGTSISGVAQFIASRGTGKLKEWCDRGYDEVARVDARLSEWLAIPRSVKTTCVKPSGTVSLLAGATPGMHFPESRFYLRRVRLGKDHELVQPLQDAGYAVEPAAEDPSRKLVVTFPVDAAASTVSTTSVSVSNDGSERLVDCSSSSSSSLLTLDDVTMWEQLSLAALLQRYWADNQVSCTVTFDPEREGKQIARALDFFQYQLKGVSLLPRAPILQYKQLPYEACTEAQYKEAVSKIRPGYISEVISGIRPSSSLKQSKATDNYKAPDNFCDTESCDKS
jgi:ribonucleoside-triphosphate reductase